MQFLQKKFSISEIKFMRLYNTEINTGIFQNEVSPDYRER